MNAGVHLCASRSVFQWTEEGDLVLTGITLENATDSRYDGVVRCGRTSLEVGVVHTVSRQTDKQAEHKRIYANAQVIRFD